MGQIIQNPNSVELKPPSSDHAERRCKQTYPHKQKSNARLAAEKERKKKKTKFTLATSKTIGGNTPRKPPISFLLPPEKVRGGKHHQTGRRIAQQKQILTP